MILFHAENRYPCLISNYAMKCTCVLEFSPGDYTEHTYDSPNGSLADFPEEWNTYWQKCLSDSGLGHLKAISPGSYFVDIRQLQASDLRIMLKRLLTDVETPVDELNPLCGGIVITNKDEFLLYPMCCGDLESVQQWESIQELEAGKWHQLWIGHPWVYVRREQGMIAFSDYTEKNPEDFVPHTRFELSETTLCSGLVKIRRELDVFTQLVRIVLEELQLQDAVMIARQLAGGVEL